MKPNLKTITTLTLISLLSGCLPIGTCQTRTTSLPAKRGVFFYYSVPEPSGESFGGYPYLGTALSAGNVAVGIAQLKMPILSIISTPIDAAIDTIFLPFDLIGWVGGKWKVGDGYVSAEKHRRKVARWNKARKERQLKAAGEAKKKKLQPSTGNKPK
jgi:hypothetical protein